MDFLYSLGLVSQQVTPPQPAPNGDRTPGLAIRVPSQVGTDATLDASRFSYRHVSLGELIRSAENYSIVAKTDVEDRRYVVAKSPAGCVIQSLADWDTSNRSGLFLGFNGSVHFDQNVNTIKAIFQLIQIGDGEDIVHIEATPYVIAKGEDGIAIQSVNDYMSNLESGLHLSNDGKVTFDGDLKCLKFIAALIGIGPDALATSDSPPAEAEIQAPLAPQAPEVLYIREELENTPDAAFQPIWKSANIGSPNAALINAEMLNRLMGSNGIYNHQVKIRANANNLAAYLNSPEFIEHQKTVKVYVGNHLSMEEAKAMATMREPVNIAQGRFYDVDRAKDLFGYEMSYFQTDGEKLHGNGVVSIYSRTFLWNPPGGDSKKEVAVLSVYAPALDSPNQPRAAKFIVGEPQMENNQLKKEAYRDHMQEVAESIVRAAIDHKETTNRLVIPLIGQSAFVSTLSAQGKQEAFAIFQETLAEAFSAHKVDLEGMNIVISEYSGNLGRTAAENISALSGMPIGSILGDIKVQSQNGDLIVNAWDPHSAPGNGNDGDNSFDGQIGRATGILLTQTNWFNPALNDPEVYQPIVA